MGVGQASMTFLPILTVALYRLPSWDIVMSVARLYLKYCNYQPLPLFSSENFMATLNTRDSDLIFAILALATRFLPTDPDAPVLDSPSTAEMYAHSAIESVMRRIFRGPVELSTIQTLCILSLLQFNSE
jgi:hypothetical protein